jgi:uncharacterized membrane protein
VTCIVTIGDCPFVNMNLVCTVVIRAVVCFMSVHSNRDELRFWNSRRPQVLWSVTAMVPVLLSLTDGRECVNLFFE